MRGSPAATGRDQPGPGPIPAHAGEPRRGSCCSGGSGAYPRACGGAPPVAKDGTTPEGLSPRMRGSRGIVGAGSSFAGPIPAHAGEPMPPRPRESLPWAYPRACGGASNRPTPTSCKTGLSPRMRGSQLERLGGERGRGPIPAHAGEPCRRSGTGGALAAYPRACGGAGRSVDHNLCHHGLSPRMRGSPAVTMNLANPLGPIPAHAGEPA